MAKPDPSASASGQSTGRPPRYLLVLLVLAALWAVFWGVVQLYSQEPETVTLGEQEQQQLDQKLRVLSGEDDPDAVPLAPEVYEETDEARILRFTERELNALIARDPGLAGRVALRLTPGQVSTRVRVDVPEDIPLLGGRVLNVRSGVRFETEGEQLSARLVGVSVAGVPLPDAWLGGLKDEDLLAMEPFRHLRAGIEAIEVSEGELSLQLAR